MVRLHERASRCSWALQLCLRNIRRVLAYFQWKASWWLVTVAGSHTGAISKSEEGIIAYANKQATILEKLAIFFRSMWIPFVNEDLLPEVVLSDRSRLFTDTM